MSTTGLSTQVTLASSSSRVAGGSNGSIRLPRTNSPAASAGVSAAGVASVDTLGASALVALSSVGGAEEPHPVRALAKQASSKRAQPGRRETRSRSIIRDARIAGGSGGGPMAGVSLLAGAHGPVKMANLARLFGAGQRRLRRRYSRKAGLCSPRHSELERGKAERGRPRRR